MMYGLGLPVLFPLTLINLIITYVVHKLATVYWNQKSNILDDTLNKNAVYYLKYGALLHVGFAYWMLTNKQMFYNEFEKLYYKREVTMSLHTVYDYPADHTLYMLGFCVVVVAYLIFFEVFYECFSFLVRPS